MSTNLDVRSAILVRLTIAILAIIWLSGADAHSLTQRPSNSRSSRAVDEVTLTNGKKIYGIVMQQVPNDGLTMMVERAWFEKAYSKLYASHLESELQSKIAAQTKQLFRLEAWWKSRVVDADLVAFIDHEMERIEQNRDAQKAKGIADLKPFTLVFFPAGEVKNVHVQAPAHHKIAGLAWKHKLDRVSIRSVTALRRELERLKVDTNAETFDLSSQLPESRGQSEIEWNARVALIEYKLRTQLEFQGMGSNLIRTDPNRPENNQADPKALIKQFISGALTSGNEVDALLTELGLGTTKKPDKPWWENAAKIAEAENISGFLASRVIQNASSPTATVESCFVAQVKPGQWKQIVRLAASANRNDVDQANVDRIKGDPQVKKVLDITKNLGLGSDDIVDQAIRQGAATETALFDSRNKFFDFLNRFTERTDRPMLSIK